MSAIKEIKAHLCGQCACFSDAQVGTLRRNQQCGNLTRISSAREFTTTRHADQDAYFKLLAKDGQQDCSLEVLHDLVNIPMNLHPEAVLHEEEILPLCALLQTLAVEEETQEREIER